MKTTKLNALQVLSLELLHAVNPDVDPKELLELICSHLETRSTL